MIYKHAEWTVEVSEHSDFLQVAHDAVFRRTMRLDKKCELFTLLRKNSDEALVQIQLFDDGFAHFEAYSPLLLHVDYKKRFVLIGMFDTSTWHETPWKKVPLT